MPSHKTLCAREASIVEGQPPSPINLTALILGAEADATSEPEAGNANDAEAEAEALPPQDGDQP